MKNQTSRAGSDAARFFKRKARANPGETWGRPSARLKGAIAWFQERKVPMVHIARVIGVSVSSYGRWHRQSVWPGHARGYALCALYRAMHRYRALHECVPADVLAEYMDEERFSHHGFVQDWGRLVDALVQWGYTLLEVGAYAGLHPNNATYVHRGATAPNFAQGELLLDMYWRHMDDCPTRPRPASEHPGRIPDRPAQLRYWTSRFEPLRPLIAMAPGGVRLKEPEFSL